MEKHQNDSAILAMPSKPIISIKEARKIIGKEVSEKLDDAYLAEIVGQLSYLAKTLLTTIEVPQKEKVV